MKHKITEFKSSYTHKNSSVDPKIQVMYFVPGSGKVEARRLFKLLNQEGKK